MSAAAADKTQRESVFVCGYMWVYRGRRGADEGDEKKSAPRMQDMEAPTERRVLIGCLETTASGRGISMHEICRQREKEEENRGRDHSNITMSLSFSLWLSLPLLPLYEPETHQTRLVAWQVMLEHQAFGYRSSLLLPMYPSSLRVVISLYQTAKHLLLSLLSFRVPMLGHAGHGIGFDHWQPDHGVLSYGPELGTRECPSVDQQDGVDLAASAPALHQRVAAGGSWRGEAGEGANHPGREAPWEQSLHEEVPPRLQQQWLRLEDGVGHQWEQAKGESFCLVDYMLQYPWTMLKGVQSHLDICSDLLTIQKP